jgi:large subunit ribosomal protein L5
MAAKSTKKEAKAESAGPAVELPAMPRLQERYEKEVLPHLRTTYGRDNRLSLPRLVKIVVSMGVGTAVQEKKHMEEALAALQQITGQKPAPCKSRVAISNFKLRQGLEIGAKVTLRGPRMWEFLDRLLSLALPRVRDFRGVNPKAFDGNGNYSIGLTEQLVFPEINPDKFTRTQGMNIAFITSTDSNDEARELLRALGMPFRIEEKGGSKSPAA